MKQKTLNFFNSNAGRAVSALLLLFTVWLWRSDLHSQKTATWISEGHGTFGQIFDLGLMIGALLGVALCLLCIPKSCNHSSETK